MQCEGSHWIDKRTLEAQELKAFYAKFMGLAFSLLRLLVGKLQGVGEECNQIHILEITLTGMWGLEVGIPARRLTKVRVNGMQECKA